jgi:hypothetical protein
MISYRSSLRFVPVQWFLAELWPLEGRHNHAQCYWKCWTKLLLRKLTFDLCSSHFCDIKYFNVYIRRMYIHWNAWGCFRFFFTKEWKYSTNIYWESKMKQVKAVIIISQTSTHICLHVTVLYIDHNLNPVMIIYKKQIGLGNRLKKNLKHPHAFQWIYILRIYTLKYLMLCYIFIP